VIRWYKRWCARRELLFAARSVAVSYTPELEGSHPYDPDELFYLQACAVKLYELEGNAGEVFPTAKPPARPLSKS
jgi:hypothetical protein